MQINQGICAVWCEQQRCRPACPYIKSTADNKGKDQPAHLQNLLPTTKVQIKMLIDEICCNQQRCRSACSSLKSAANNKGADQPAQPRCLLLTTKLQISLLSNKVRLLICPVSCEQRRCRSAYSSGKPAWNNSVYQSAHPQSVLLTTEVQFSLLINEICCIQKVQISLLIHKVCCQQRMCRSACSSTHSLLWLAFDMPANVLRTAIINFGPTLNQCYLYSVSYVGPT